ncbi:MAG: transcription antitermination factor NusB [Actinomycetota bacterium]|nr:transcription antitermination factor NusB [Actinomycetota bacterium]
MKQGVETRVVTVTLLRRILEDGAYSNIIVRTATKDLQRRDLLFVQRLLYTTIRYLDRIDRTIDDRVSRPVDDDVRAVLRVGVAEILFMDGDAYAAVDSAVEAVRVGGSPRASGFVNGVLRNIVRDGEPKLPDGPEGEALRLGTPLWLFEDLVEAYGSDTAIAFLDASNQPTSVGVRRRRGEAPGEAIEGIEDAFHIENVVPFRSSIASGDLVIADPSSTAVAAALDPQPGDRVLDLAAAPGGKTLHLSDLLGGEGMIVGMDRNARRVATAQRRLRRLSADVQWVIGDAVKPPFENASFDRILLDAPCTGLGTLRRRPEIRHRLRPESASEAGRAQRQMLDAAVSLLRPGGRLVYSVCTVTQEETADVVSGVDSHAPEGLPGSPIAGGILLAPHVTGSDGMFVAVIDG